MTEIEVIDHALSAVETRPGAYSLFKRNGRILLALPAGSVAAGRTLCLYQPQRLKARFGASATQILIALGLHRMFFPKYQSVEGRVLLDPEFSGCIPGTAGLMLGSPEHKVRRAILCYQAFDGWEVAKLAFGKEGRAMIDGESSAIRSLPRKLLGAPELRGVHHCELFSLLRMARVQGLPFSPSHSQAAVNLLDSWIQDSSPMAAEAFPEWNSIQTALKCFPAGFKAIEALVPMQLKPVVRHGDFARWNLIRKDDGAVVVLDWEWGHSHGMPGLDLVHYFLQDARLVERLAPSAAIERTCAMMDQSVCRQYLEKTGWSGNTILPIIASLAWKQGAGHQENASILEAAVREYSKMGRE